MNKILISILLILPIYIQADTFDYEVSKTNEYLSGSDYVDDYNRYLLDGKERQINYGFKRGKIEYAPLFIMGGFLSSDEYKITKINNNSYLYDGINYWTLTQKEDEEKYYIIDEQEAREKNLDYKNKTTEYTKNEVRVRGSGTLKDPWVFVPMYNINVNAKNGTVEYPNGKVTSDEITIKASPNSGYRYITNDCGNYAKYDSLTNEMTFDNVNKDLDCTVIFGLGLYKIQIGEVPEEGEVEPKIIYSKFGEGFYKDSEGQNIIRNLTKNPTKTGYTFKGYEYDNGKGTKIQIIDGTGKIDQNKASEIVEDTTLKVKWEVNKYTVTLNTMGGQVPQDKIIVTYGQPYGTLPIAKLLGSGFDGWFTKATGGTEVTAETIANTPRNHMLYAHYTQCTEGNYTNGITGVCNKCPNGYTVASGAGTSIDSCYISVAENYYVKQANDATTTQCATGYESPAHTVKYGKTSTCTVKKVKTTFNKNDGSNITLTKEYIYNGKNQFFPNEPANWERVGYILRGWSTTPKGNVEFAVNTAVTNDWIIANTPAKTLYAVWDLQYVTADNYCCSGSCTPGEKIFNYTGKCIYIDDGDKNWRIKFLTSGTLTFTSSLNIDAFLVGGGGGGSSGWNANGVGGGGAGYTKTSKNLTVDSSQSYNITIGNGGAQDKAGGATTAFSITANGGNPGSGQNGGNGGSGGGSASGAKWSDVDGSIGTYAGAGGSDGDPGGTRWQGKGGTGQGTTTREFAESTGDLYAGGGGGAATGDYEGGKGGEGGGGHGGKYGMDGFYGVANSGGGGGGGGYQDPTWKYGGNGGSGGSGIVVIRNSRQ